MPYKDREFRLQFMRDWYANNKDHVRRYRRKNAGRLYALRRDWLEKNPHKKFMFTKQRKAIVRYKGKLSICTIQKLYEDNISQYRTLTCYLCLKPVKFGKDSLDHKIPATRGGTNDYENLGIAHLECNGRKRSKTVEEYHEYLKNISAHFS